MDWGGIACIVIASVTVNHLGLVAAVERVVRRPLPVVDCPKCLTFWSVLVYGLSGDGFAANPSGLARLLAISLLCAYMAVWLELAEGFIDKLYDYIYGKIYTTEDTADNNEASAWDVLSELSRDGGGRHCTDEDGGKEENDDEENGDGRE